MLFWNDDKLVFGRYECQQYSYMSQANRKAKILIPVGAVLILGSFGFAFMQAQELNKARTQKFRMPGNYETYLVAGSYMVWIMNRWKPVAINEAPGAAEFRLIDSSGKEVPIEQGTIGFEVKEDQKGGTDDAKGVQIRENGIYEIQATSKTMKNFVVALVPISSIHWGPRSPKRIWFDG